MNFHMKNHLKTTDYFQSLLGELIKNHPSNDLWHFSKPLLFAFSISEMILDTELVYSELHFILPSFIW